MPIEPGRRDCRDEKLTAVRVGSSIGHADEARADMFEIETLVVEVFSVNAQRSRSVALVDIAPFFKKTKNQKKV